MLATSKQLDIDNQQVLHSIGYDTDCEPPARVASLVNEYLENANHLVDVSYSYTIRDVEWVRGPIALIEDSIIFKSQVIARLLEQCEKTAVFVLTIGKHLEEMVCQLAKDKLVLQASVLDAIGSVAAEKVADFVQDRIREVAGANGLCTSRRFSPGYCDWSIGQQKMLFWALSGNTVGVRLTGRCLMIPQKSISGIIGIGSADSNVENYNPCKTCNKYDCPGRKQDTRHDSKRINWR